MSDPKAQSIAQPPQNLQPQTPEAEEQPESDLMEGMETQLPTPSPTPAEAPVALDVVAKPEPRVAYGVRLRAVFTLETDDGRKFDIPNESYHGALFAPDGLQFAMSTVSDFVKNASASFTRSVSTEIERRCSNQQQTASEPRTRTSGSAFGHS